MVAPRVLACPFLGLNPATNTNARTPHVLGGTGLARLAVVLVGEPVRRAPRRHRRLPVLCPLPVDLLLGGGPRLDQGLPAPRARRDGLVPGPHQDIVKHLLATCLDALGQLLAR